MWLTSLDRLPELSHLEFSGSQEIGKAQLFKIILNLSKKLQRLSLTPQNPVFLWVTYPLLFLPRSLHSFFYRDLPHENCHVIVMAKTGALPCLFSSLTGTCQIPFSTRGGDRAPLWDTSSSSAVVAFPWVSARVFPHCVMFIQVFVD